MSDDPFDIIDDLRKGVNWAEITPRAMYFQNIRIDLNRLEQSVKDYAAEQVRKALNEIAPVEKKVEEALRTEG